MTWPDVYLVLIQKAGQAVHNASEEIALTLHSQAEGLVASVASQPFGIESEQLIVRFKTLARLNQDLSSVEAQLRVIYAAATELASPVSDVLITLPSLSKRSISNGSAEDVSIKPAKGNKRKKPKTKQLRRRSGTPGGLTANDLRLLEYLKGVLKTDAWTAHTGATMATGSGLPLGSVGLSLKKILLSGAAMAGDRGMYRLSEPNAAVEN